MKRVLLLIFFCISVAIIAQAYEPQYRVYSYQGNVQYKLCRDTASWRGIEEELRLSLMDSLYLYKDSYVRIEYISQHTIYKIVNTGKTSIMDAVIKARSDNARRIIKALNKEISSGRSDTMKQSMEVLGVGTRGFDVMPINDDIDYYALAEQLSWIGAQACKKNKSPQIKGIVFKSYKPNNDELNFEFENNTGKDYYINVLHINKRTNSVSLCYVITPDIQEEACPITPSGFCTCSMGVNFPDTKDDMYVLVAIDQPYDSYVLDQELRYHHTDDVEKTNLDIKYMW